MKVYVASNQSIAFNTFFNRFDTSARLAFQFLFFISKNLIKLLLNNKLQERKKTTGINNPISY